MKSLKCLSILLVLFTMSVPTAFASSGTITVSNGTAYTLTELYASPTSNATWDLTSNLLAGLTIAPGVSSTITIPGSSDDNCSFDLMAVLYGVAEHAYTYQVTTCHGASGNWTVSQ